jgi:hypothetical protein
MAGAGWGRRESRREWKGSQEEAKGAEGSRGEAWEMK